MHFFYQALIKKSSLYRNHKEKKNEDFSHGNKEIEFHNVLIQQVAKLLRHFH